MSDSLEKDVDDWDFGTILLCVYNCVDEPSRTLHIPFSESKDKDDAYLGDSMGMGKDSIEYGYDISF